tara:strand:+ start:152 stop:340 length:189 start_codon:yes stop_codon:yes gene_type:complete
MKEGLSIGDDYGKNNIDKANMSKPQPSKLKIFFNSFWLAGKLNILGSKANISRAPIATNQKR